MHILTLLKNRLNRDQMAGEQGFTLIELLIVIVILGILAAIAVPTYLSFVSSAHTSAAQSNVRTAIPAAEDFYQLTTAQGGGNQSYTGMTGAKLRTIAPGVSANVRAVALDSANGYDAYCIEDAEPNWTNPVASSEYYYVGGNASAAGVLTGTGVADTLTQGTCTSATGTAGT